MNPFSFSKDDLGRPVKELWPLNRTSSGDRILARLEDFGLTKKVYLVYENLDFFNKWFPVRNDQIELETLVRCHLYNLINMECKEPLAVVLKAYGLESTECTESSSLEAALHTAGLAELLSVGWTFWSIALGTFAHRWVGSKPKTLNTLTLNTTHTHPYT